MFSELLNYRDQKFYEDHKTIVVYTSEGLIKYEVQSVFIADPNEPYRNIMFNENEYSDFHQEISWYEWGQVWL